MSLILLGNLYMSLIKVSLINHNVCTACKALVPKVLKNISFLL